MKNVLLFFIFSAVLAAIFALSMPFNGRLPLNDRQRNNIIGCGVDYQGDVEARADGKFIVALPGWGNYTYHISTLSDSAQFYFNQGLNMHYGYHMREAIASFKEASRFDPSCPMVYWGEALSMGPEYNSAHNYVKSKDVAAVLRQMNE